MAKVSLMDLAFLLAETDASPKHVGGLMIFKKPANVASGHGHELVRQLVSSYLGTAEDVRPPFNQIVKFDGLKPPQWQAADNFSINNHVFFHQLTGEDFRNSLHQQVGELHSQRLQRDLPMWQCHVFEGIDEQRFALFIKIHHAYADGITMAAWLARSLSTCAETTAVTPIWQQIRSSERAKAPPLSLLPLLLKQLRRANRNLLAVLGFGKLSTQLALEMVNLTKNAVALPFSASRKTPLSGQVQEGRQIATAAVPMARVNRLRRHTRSTLNHIALTCVDGALHRYLSTCDADIDQPITILMPVNLRKEGDDSVGNKIGMVLVDLASKTNDPYERLREIGFTLRNVRYQVDGVPAGSVVAYTAVLGGVAMLTEFFHLGDAVPPLGHTLVSNVPGPPESLFLNGAELEDMYPVSALPPNNNLNITLFSYAGRLYFGLVGTAAMPELSLLGDYISEAFTELEAAVGLDIQA